MKIDKLTPEQEALIPVVVKRWIDRFKSAEVNPELAIKQIHWLYKFCKMNQPDVVLVDSPAAAQIAANLIKSSRTKTGANVEANVRANVWANVWANVRANVEANVEANVRANVEANVRDNVWANVGANVRANVGANVGANVRANVGANVEANVEANVRDNVWANVGANVRANVGANVGANVRDNVGANVEANVWANVGANVWANVGANVWDNKLDFHSFSSYGNISDYGWVAFYDYFNEIKFDLKNPSYFEFRQLILSGVYDMIQFEKCCIAISLPLYVKRDNKNRMHCTTGPAILFRDGYAQWYWKGTFVPRHWVESPETLTKEEIKEKSKNAETRRVLIEILGVAEYYKKLGGKGLKVIDQDNDNQGNPMRLLSFDFEGRVIQMLECVCPSTKRVYNIGVPSQKATNCWWAKAEICQITHDECRRLTHES